MTLPPEQSEALLELAARVEAASGSDRELDADIRLAVLGDCQYGVITGNRHQVVGRAYLSDYVAAYRSTLTADDALHDDAVPRYTASLDAAMTLVPEGAGFNLDRYWIREGVRWKCEIATGGIPENPRKVFDCWDAYTPALALCAAALRARSLALQPGGE